MSQGNESVPITTENPDAVAPDVAPAKEWFGPESALRGAAPFAVWMALFFGGVWYPATLRLNAMFGDSDVKVADGPVELVGVLVACFLFWTWTNIAGLCLAASALGDVCRGWNRPDVQPNFRLACTRAFFVFLVVLINDIAVVGQLTSVGTAIGDAQGVYVRLAILSSLFCFVASYRPEFFEGMIAKFGSGERETQRQQDQEPKRITDQSDRAEASGDTLAVSNGTEFHEQTLALTEPENTDHSTSQENALVPIPKTPK